MRVADSPNSARSSAEGSADEGGARGFSAKPKARRTRREIHHSLPSSACFWMAAGESSRPKPQTTKPSSGLCFHASAASSGIHAQISGSASEEGTCDHVQQRLQPMCPGCNPMYPGCNPMWAVRGMMSILKRTNPNPDPDPDPHLRRTMSILKRKTMSRKKPSSGKFSSISRDSPER